MTIENWIGVGSIVATLVSGFGAVILQVRLTRPEPKPDASQPRKRSEKRGGWLSRLVTSPPLFILLAVLSAGQLALLVRSTAPVTRSAVFWIAVYVAGVLWNLGTVAMLTVIRAMDRAVQVFGESTIDLIQNDRRMLGLIEKAAQLPAAARATERDSASPAKESDRLARDTA